MMISARTLLVAGALVAAGLVVTPAQSQGWGGGWGGGPGWGGCGWSQGCGGGGGPGYGRGYGRGPGWRGQGGSQMSGPCVSGQNAPCWRVQNPERHAACWKEADAKGLRAAARRSFMTSCMTSAAKAP